MYLSRVSQINMSLSRWAPQQTVGLLKKNKTEKQITPKGLRKNGAKKNKC